MTAMKNTKTELLERDNGLFSITHDQGVGGIASGLLLRERLSPYSWDRTGTVLRLNLNNDDHLTRNELVKHVAECLSKEALRYAGDKYFENNPGMGKEKWQVWRLDARFMNTYCTDEWNQLLQLTLKELAETKSIGLHLPADYEKFSDSVSYFKKIEDDFLTGSHISEMQKMGW